MRKILAQNIAPNNDIKDGFLSVATWFYSQKSLTRLKQKSINAFSQLVGAGSDKLFFVDSGRSALGLLLKSLHLPKDSEILIQTFSCAVVPNAILYAGLKPVVCDIEDKTYNIDLVSAEKNITKNTKILLIQHNFGYAQDIQPILDFCKKHNLILIEDCASALGCYYTFQGKRYHVGSFGHAIYSFGREKQISTTIGGVIRLNHSSSTSVFDKEYKDLPEMTTKRNLKSLYYIFLIVFLVRPFYYIANIGKLLLFLSLKCKLVETSISKGEEKFDKLLRAPSKFGIRLYPILYKQLQDFTKTQAHRETIANIYKESLNLDKISQNNFFFVVDLNKMKRIQDVQKVFGLIMHNLRYRQSVLAVNYNTLFVPLKKLDFPEFNYNVESTPTAKKLVNNTIFCLPTGIRVTESDARRISDDIIKTINNNA